MSKTQRSTRDQRRLPEARWVDLLLRLLMGVNVGSLKHTGRPIHLIPAVAGMSSSPASRRNPAGSAGSGLCLGPGNAIHDVPPQVVSGREQWMIEVLGQMVGHADLLHDTPRADVIRDRVRYDLAQQ